MVRHVRRHDSVQRIATANRRYRAKQPDIISPLPTLVFFSKNPGKKVHFGFSFSGVDGTVDSIPVLL